MAPVSVSTIRRWILLAAALLLVSLVLAACGDDDNNTSASGDGGTTAAQSAPEASSARSMLAETAQESGGLSFSSSELTARAGNVTVTLDNPSGNRFPHAIEIEGNGVEEESETIEPGARSSVTVDLRPGRYTFYCPVGEHRAAGMEGTLTVQ